MQVADLRASDGRHWTVAALSRRDAPFPGAEQRAVSLDALAGEAADAILFLDDSLRAPLQESLEMLWEEMPEGESTFMVLVPRQPAPVVDPYFCEPVTSFLCSRDVFSAYVALRLDCWPQSVLFAILRAIADGAIEVDRLLVRQLPAAARPKPHSTDSPKALLMPHRGDPGFLRTALRYLLRTAGNSLSIDVGLDVEDATEYRDVMDAYPTVRFFQPCPAPVGPYVIRQELAERNTAPFLCLQDSDDISTFDRFAVLAAAMAETRHGVVGSHELCLDEICVKVYPVRYPLDASAALAMCPNHALLHATLMARREAYFGCGGLSTHLPIASDTQFLLRAFFATQIRNVDEFLYVRRRHPASLTNAPETIHDNPLRRALNREWTGDFEAVKRGELKIEDSSLRPIRRTEPYRIERL